MKQRITRWMIVPCLMAVLTSAEGSSGRVKRAGGILFPPNSGMGVFLALAVPVDLPQYELSLSYNFEANYLLPDNLTELEQGPQITQIRYARSITRSRIYDVVEQRFEREGLKGRSCLLKTICETSATPILGHNGLLGDLIHLIFTPSASEPENILSDFIAAEEIGAKQGLKGCADSYNDCTIDIYHLFTVWSH